MASPTATTATRRLTRAALPLVPQLGFSSQCLQAAASPSPLSSHTLNALFPSPPASDPSPSSLSLLRNLALAKGPRSSRSRHELIALARGHGSAPRDRERTGPARALVDEWLVKGREDMVAAVAQSRLTGDDALRVGVRERLAYNEPVLDKLPEALALLSAPTSTYLNNPLSALPWPSPVPHLTHVAHIAQDLAKASGSHAQGTEWYTLRLRLSTIYALSELSLLSPPAPSLSASASASSPSATPPAERIAAAQQYAERLFDQSAKLGTEVHNAALFLEWVRKSWMGLARSVLA
ncbi:hypothetical protein DMC30DRAFT_414128 [Rhodotorula diobovata]|uniref:COQ9 C-terminal domain-containing protein n=1 Tax=Rhodotorula diobovata TaxID=5288 RepID=A0A5C5G2Y3_9BASI|nr:hypothetical protein DMC30DRAFT_414128 [Rhodotorula diobovata]